MLTAKRVVNLALGYFQKHMVALPPPQPPSSPNPPLSNQDAMEVLEYAIGIEFGPRNTPQGERFFRHLNQSRSDHGQNPSPKSDRWVAVRNALVAELDSKANTIGIFGYRRYREVEFGRLVLAYWDQSQNNGQGSAMITGRAQLPASEIEDASLEFYKTAPAGETLRQANHVARVMFSRSTITNPALVWRTELLGSLETAYRKMGRIEESSALQLSSNVRELFLESSFEVLPRTLSGSSIGGLVVNPYAASYATGCAEAGLGFYGGAIVIIDENEDDYSVDIVIPESGGKVGAAQIMMARNRASAALSDPNGSTTGGRWLNNGADGAVGIYAFTDGSGAHADGLAEDAKIVYNGAL